MILHSRLRRRPGSVPWAASCPGPQWRSRSFRTRWGERSRTTWHGPTTCCTSRPCPQRQLNLGKYFDRAAVVAQLTMLTPDLFQM